MKKRFPAIILTLILCFGLAVPSLAADGVTYYLSIDEGRASVSVSTSKPGSSTLSLAGEGLEHAGTYDHHSVWGTTPIFTARNPVTITLTDGYTTGKVLSEKDAKGETVYYPEVMYIGVDRLSYNAATNKFTTVDEDIVDFDGSYALDPGENGKVKERAGTLQHLRDVIGNLQQFPMIYKGATATISEPGFYYVYVDRPPLRECDAFIRVMGSDDSLFTDLPEWCAGAVDWAVDERITNGTDVFLFSPGMKCTQTHILTFLYRAVRGEGAATADDLDKAVDWAREKGMIGDDFNGNAPCTRSTAMSYIWQTFDSPEAKASSFTDVDAGADYAAAVSWAYANGITNGNGDTTTFGPDETCTRGQIVTFLHRAYVEEARLTVE